MAWGSSSGSGRGQYQQQWQDQYLYYNTQAAAAAASSHTLDASFRQSATVNERLAIYDGRTTTQARLLDLAVKADQYVATINGASTNTHGRL